MANVSVNAITHHVNMTIRTVETEHLDVLSQCNQIAQEIRLVAMKNEIGTIACADIVQKTASRAI